MEGILLAASIFESPVAIIGAGFGLAVVLQMILLGYVADEDAKGRHIVWLEEPQPGLLARIPRDRKAKGRQIEWLGGPVAMGA